MNTQQNEVETIELISFKTCPFVQRSVIMLLKKNIDFKVTYIDFTNKPDWFMEISPLGKVPVVKFGESVLFESSAINEFLDEITPPSLMPEAPIVKAQTRAWVEFSSQLFSSQHMAAIADNQKDLDFHVTALLARLKRLEEKASGDQYLISDKFGLLDSAIAPLFTRFKVFEERFSLNLLSGFPKLNQLGKNYLSLEYIRQSVVPDFPEIYVEYLRGKNSVLAS